MELAVHQLSVIDWVPSGEQVSADLFHTNVVQTSNTGSPWFADDPDNPLGIPTKGTQGGLDHFGIRMVRFPGGEVDGVFADGMLIDGALTEGVVNMLGFAAQAEISVNMVVPVDTPDGFTRAEFLQQITAFAATVEAQFPGVVRAFELGNEYWGGRAAFDDTLEFDYGVNAGEVAVALAVGMQGAGYDAQVFLQAAGNLRGSFDNDLVQANGDIQAGFEQVDGAMDSLDGIIRNNYWRDPDLDGFENTSGTFGEDRGLGLNLDGGENNWEDWIGRDLVTMVGEYNINRNIALGDGAVDIGIHGASYMLEHVANMVEAGVDRAFLWPITHNTQNALLFRDEDVTTETVHGLDIATNTTRVAMIDLMRQTVSAHELVTTDWSIASESGSPDNSVELTLFAGAPEDTASGMAEQIAFLSSRTPESMYLEIDLSGFVTEFDSLRATSIFYDSDGGNLRDAIVSEITPRQISDDAVFGFELRPYEVVQLIFATGTAEDDTSTPDPADDVETLLAFEVESVLAVDAETSLAVDVEPLPAVAVTNPVGPLRIWDNDLGNTLFGDAGDDVIFARGGDDSIEAGGGDDFVRGAAGSDVIDGGSGADTLHGDLGNDHLWGGAQDDVLDGGYGDDRLSGGAGNDTLTGGFGADRFVHADLDRGFDVILDFQIGQDTLVFEDTGITGPDGIRLISYIYQDTHSTLIRFLDAEGAVDRSLGGIVLNGVAPSDLSDESFEFAAPEPSPQPEPISDASHVLPGFEELPDLHELLLPYAGDPDDLPHGDIDDDADLLVV